jgi:beta-galactosidase
MNLRKLMTVITVWMTVLTMNAQNVRETIRLDEGWKFAFGNAADPAKDFGCGTEYFNYLTKANSIHNEGPYSPKFDDSKWEEVRIPHDWVTTLSYEQKASHSHGYKTVGYKYPETSVGWYRKIVKIEELKSGSSEDLPCRYYLQFDGIFRNANIWFNGFWLGTEPSGYATQVYDVTEYVNYGGDNLICVRADATLEEGWFYEGAGIYRDAWLVKTGKVSVAPFGTFVYADMKAPYTTATMVVETEIHNSTLATQSCQVEQRLLDADGKEVGRMAAATMQLKGKQTSSCKQQMTVSHPHLWSTTDPYLYQVETTVKVDGKVTDVYTTTTGFREVVFDADKGFLLNGKSIELKGANMHQDHAGVGAAIPDALQAWRIQQLKKFGCNAYRASHNPMTPALLDICDREGILVIDENRLSGINTEHLRLLENMIKRDRNHPSVILWSDGNEEWGMENTIQGTRIAAAMREYTKLLDPTRHSTIANAGGGEMIKGLDVVGFNYILQNDVDNRKKNNPTWKIVGTEETTGCGTRGVYFDNPEFPGRMVSMNRSADKDGTYNRIERGWKFYADRPWAAGLFYWTGFDYRGEPNPLSFPGHDPEFGILDYCGFWKDEAWYLKSWWTDEPTLHIFPHWNLQGHEGEEVEVWAYSNCDEVELTVNSKKLGRQKMPKNGHLKWKAVYQPGKVVAVGYKNGKRILTETIETTKPADRIIVKSNRPSITADGRDVAIVTIELQDAKGRVVPDACQPLTFRIEGNGRIIGAGNGDPSYPGADHPKDKDCKEFSIPAFNGYAQVIIQSEKSAGNILLQCTSTGLKSGTVNIRSAQ